MRMIPGTAVNDIILQNALDELDTIRARLDSFVVGCDAVKDILLTCARRALLTQRGSRPAGSLVFTGPTGAGKTFIIEAFAAALAHNPRTTPDSTEGLPLIRINGSEYCLDHEIARIIGAPPGYVGHKETEPVLSKKEIETRCAMSRSGFFVILFDEIEKASRNIEKLLLNILEGHLRLGDGSQAPLGNAFIFFTSNCGAEEAYRMKPGLAEQAPVNADPDTLRAHYTREFRRRWAPELINRIGAIIPFDRLTHADLVRIADNRLKTAAARSHVPFHYDPEIPEYLAARADKTYGARDIIRLVEQAVDVVHEAFHRLRPENAGIFHLVLAAKAAGNRLHAVYVEKTGATEDEVEGKEKIKQTHGAAKKRGTT